MADTFETLKAALEDRYTLERQLGAGGMTTDGIIVMKVVPAVPGSFTRNEWIALGGWLVLGLALSGGRWRTVDDGGGR